MLVELAVRNLGAIESARVTFTDGLVALTGETGAGKTMLIEALSLLSGRRADPARIRLGADEAVVEGLFALGDDEWALRRVISATGRSRAYVNGDLATLSTLSEVADTLIELHGQHAQQHLLSIVTHRDALDDFAGLDTSELTRLKARTTELSKRLQQSDDDERSRAREEQLLAFQIDEIEAVGLSDGEDDLLSKEEATLADAVAHVQAGQLGLDYLSSEGGVLDRLAEATQLLSDRVPYDAIVTRLLALSAELDDCSGQLRAVCEGIEPDPERLSEIQQRRSAIADLRRKYGSTEAEVLAFRDNAASRLESLRSFDDTLRADRAELVEVLELYGEEARRVGALRRKAAPRLGEMITGQLHRLALPTASVDVTVADSVGADIDASPDSEADIRGHGHGDGGRVEFHIATSQGMRPGPLSKVASGGELSRVMLALQLVLRTESQTIVFDEIDAGIGGEAAIEVGRALSELAGERQVLVVTHLPQIAAFADSQVLLEKGSGGRSDEALATTASVLTHDQRVVELSRMLSGQPDSENARRHAQELLSVRAHDRDERSSTARNRKGNQQ